MTSAASAVTRAGFATLKVWRTRAVAGTGALATMTDWACSAGSGSVHAVDINRASAPRPTIRIRRVGANLRPTAPAESPRRLVAAVSERARCPPAHAQGWRRGGVEHRMSYRDDVDAARARTEALGRELA